MINGTLKISSFYKEHHTWLVKWIAKQTYSIDNAQDIAQNTFLRLLDKPELINNVHKPRGWLAKIAGNLIIDQARRQLLEKNYLMMLATLPEEEHPNPDKRLEIIELLEKVDQLLEELRPIEKQAYLMIKLDGSSYKQVANELNVSLSSVEKYVAKAMLHCYNKAYGN